MGGVNNQRTTITAADWMRQMEKRLLREERRPLIRKASDIMGPGLGPFTMQTWNWDAPETSFNGMFFSAPGALNGPDDTMYWIGETQGTADGAGYQQVTDFDPVTGAAMGACKIRYFYTPVSGGARVFTDWGDCGAGSSVAPTAPYTWIEDTMGPMPLLAGPRSTPPPSEMPVEAGQVVGHEIPDVGEFDFLHISQIDAHGFNNDYFSVAPGDVLVVQSTDNGVHQLQAVTREAYPGSGGNPDYASIDYQVIATDNTPVVNKPVNVTLLSDPSGGIFLQDYHFAAASQIWTLVHNQATRAVTAYAVDTNGDQLIGEVLYPDDNTITITFAFPETGTATVYR